MKLKERFREVSIGSLHDIQCEKIADDFAIGFAEWCDNNYFRMGRLSFWSESTDWDNNKKLTTKELLQIYKKEKGLL